MDLKPLFETWSRQGEGYVFICEKSPSGWKDHKAFKWPADKRKVGALVESRINGKPESGPRRTSGVTGSTTSAGVDLYWCPLVFSGPRRDIKLSNGGNCLYADLDPVDPRSLEVRPTIAWESSPNRYQALWWIDQMLSPSEFERINKGLTYHIGADKSGWDLTQVLRIPGTSNHKTNPPKPGKLLWHEQHVFNTASIPLSDDTRGPSSSKNVTLVGLLSKYRKKFPTKVSQLLQYPDRRVTPGKRSEILWYIESELVKAKIPMEDIIQMVRLSAWNKYKGRRDEERRLSTEIQKVYENQQDFDGPVNEVDVDAEDEDDGVFNPEKLGWEYYDDMMSTIQSGNPWLVKDIWARRSQGIIAGPSKSFKSTMAMDLAISVASGKPFLGCFPVMETGPVMIIQNENSRRTMVKRIEMMTGGKGIIGKVEYDGNRILDVEFSPTLPIFSLNNTGFKFDDPLRMENLKKAVAFFKPVLVIFDPLYLMFEGDINSAKELHPMLDAVMEIKNEFNTAVIVVHHNNKASSSDRGGHNMLGSVTLHGWVESAMYITQEGESQTEEGLFTKIGIQRQFRDAGNLGRLLVEVLMENEDQGDKYITRLGESEEGNSNDLLDLLIMYPNGISQTQAAKELGIGRARLSTMMKKSDVKSKIIVEAGQRGAQNIRLRRADEDGM